MKSIRVLIVDDSPVVQRVLKDILSASTDIEVVGMASDPFEAKNQIIEKSPDVITLDIEMPRMDGITFLKRLMSFRPIPVIMVSSYTQENSRRTLEALSAGAVDFVAKPSGNVKNGLKDLGHDITSKVRAAVRAKIKPLELLERPKIRSLKAGGGASDRVIAVGASTGGTMAIRRLLGSFSADMSSIVIVQHMPARFTRAFAEQLDSIFPMEIKEAEDGDRLGQGKVFIAPGDWHLEVAADSKGYYIRLHDGAPVKHQKPSVDVMFRSVAKCAAKNAVGILLTGMGSDGTEGLLSMKEAGALTVAQDEETSVVFGMPGSAIARGAAQIVAPIDDIAAVVQGAVKG